MKYHFKVTKEGDGFWAECLEIPGCLTQGDTKEDLFANMQDAISTYLEEPEDSQYLAPLPDKTIALTKSIIEVPVEPSIALAFSIRRQRIESGLSQREAADKLGMKQVYSYQRLERRCNPTLELIAKLVALFPALSLDSVIKF